MAKITKEYQAKGNEFQVTYQRGNGPFSCVIVCAESAEVVRAWYAQENPKNKIVAVEKAVADDLKPGKSLYQVPDNLSCLPKKTRLKPLKSLKTKNRTTKRRTKK